MRIPWIDKVRNEEVLKRAGTGRKLILEIRTKQMRFLGFDEKRWFGESGIDRKD